MRKRRCNFRDTVDEIDTQAYIPRDLHTDSEYAEEPSSFPHRGLDTGWSFGRNLKRVAQLNCILHRVEERSESALCTDTGRTKITLGNTKQTSGIPQAHGMTSI